MNDNLLLLSSATAGVSETFSKRIVVYLQLRYLVIKTNCLSSSRITHRYHHSMSASDYTQTLALVLLQLNLGQHYQTLYKVHSRFLLQINTRVWDCEVSLLSFTLKILLMVLYSYRPMHARITLS